MFNKFICVLVSFKSTYNTVLVCVAGYLYLLLFVHTIRCHIVKRYEFVYWYFVMSWKTMTSVGCTKSRPMSYVAWFTMHGRSQKILSPSITFKHKAFVSNRPGTDTFELSKTGLSCSPISTRKLCIGVEESRCYTLKSQSIVQKSFHHSRRIASLIWVTLSFLRRLIVSDYVSPLYIIADNTHWSKILVLRDFSPSRVGFDDWSLSRSWTYYTILLYNIIFVDNFEHRAPNHQRSGQLTWFWFCPYSF